MHEHDADRPAISAPELEAIVARLDAARAVTGGSWTTFLETRAGIGGESFISLNTDVQTDDELHLRLWLDGEEVLGPSSELDAIVDFLGHTLEDVALLVAEVQRLRDEESAAGTA